MSQQEDIDNLYEGRVRWINVPFPQDPAWENEKSYVRQYKQYHSLYSTSMPKVPALMTYSELTPSKEPEKPHSVRVYYRSMVLKPIRWIISKDHSGLAPINGDETEGQFSTETATEETIKFEASVEFSAEVSASGGYGPVKASASLKASTGASWEKKTTVTTKRVQTVEKGFSYQPTRIYAQLLCETVHAKAGDFLANGFGELITTNARYEPVADKHKASNSGYVKAITDLSGLYDSFGKDVTTYRDEWKFLWGKMSAVNIKTVVDPADARLYVTATQASDETNYTVYDSVKYWGFRRAVEGGDSGVKTGSLVDYRGLYGKDSEKEDKAITYAPGDLVKVWKVAVKASAD